MFALASSGAVVSGFVGATAHSGVAGLQARTDVFRVMLALTAGLARRKSERAECEQRVALLRPSGLYPDMLDERVRYQLDYANPHDLIHVVRQK